MARVCAVSDSGKRAPYETSDAVDAWQLTPKSVGYEVFGPVGTVADISYFDVNADPQRTIACSIEFTTNSPAVVGDVAAQGDSNCIGCRIGVDGHGKAERISIEVNAFTYCRIKGA